jgi:Suppressor of forked protein (Suf)
MGMEDMQPDYQEDQTANAAPPPDVEYEQTFPPTTEPKTEELEVPLNHNYVDAQAIGSLDMEQPTTRSQQEQVQPVVSNQETPSVPVKTESPPVSEYESLQAHLTQNRYDTSAWNKLVDLAEQSGDLAKVKQAYESLLQAYPNTVRLFFLYIVCIFVLSDSYGCEIGSFSSLLFEGRSTDCLSGALFASGIVPHR